MKIEQRFGKNYLLMFCQSSRLNVWAPHRTDLFLGIGEFLILVVTHSSSGALSCNIRDAGSRSRCGSTHKGASRPVRSVRLRHENIVIDMIEKDIDSGATYYSQENNSGTFGSFNGSPMHNNANAGWTCSCSCFVFSEPTPKVPEAKGNWISSTNTARGFVFR